MLSPRGSVTNTQLLRHCRGCRKDYGRMMTARLIVLDVPGSGCGDIRIIGDSVSVIAEFEYSGNGQDFIGRIEFRGVKVYRFADEFLRRAS